MAIHDINLKQRSTSTKPNVSHFKIARCIAYMHVLDELRTKLDPKAKKSIFVGYSIRRMYIVDITLIHMRFV